MPPMRNWRVEYASQMTTPTAQDRAFFGHPRGLSTLFFTEMWERFSYYGMRALLLLYMTAPLSAGGLGFDAAQGGAVYGCTPPWSTWRRCRAAGSPIA